ncbi:hypothetical protein [Arthrobacter sp. BE255]|uniref:hypothetical protein n=1 Tax=Arthrobacter sp. BE255 TaxID=2817721 RepID=UPI002856F5C6|nr:hypothetical protein [Arthrobacter sp. BE255]MDR7161366.1 hypothetical protein [Arthrobacter sp. BE255]
MVLFPAIGLLIWIGFLFAVWVLCIILWLLCQTVVWLLDLHAGHARRTKASGPKRVVPPARKAPARKPAYRGVTSDIMPKWTPAHRRYVDRDRADWQEQFDTLNSRKL